LARNGGLDMNVIIANKRKELLDKLNIDVIKSLDGEYEVEELIGMFTNFFFNKMVVDITSIKDYTNVSKLQKLAKAIDMSKVILLIGDSSFESSKEFLSDIISMGIYNFASTYEGVMALFNKPNTYEDVKKYHFDTSFSNMSDDTNEVQEIADYSLAEEFEDGLRVIGVQNLTDGAGATTLTVQMVKQLNFNYKTIGIEMNKQDFVFFTVPSLYSCTNKQDAIKKIREHADCQIVVVDLNKFEHDGLCTDIIYLVEPSTIKLTKLIRRNKLIFSEVRGQKIVLNKTGLPENEVASFETELGTRVFKCVKPFNDRSDRVLTVDELLVALGFSKQHVETSRDVYKKKSGFFGRK